MIKWLEKNKFFALIITILIIIEIFYFSSLSFGSKGGGNSWIPIFYHFTVFFLLGFFIFTTIKGDKKIKIKYLIIVLIISTVYAILDEFHQLFIPFRSFSIDDILTDTTGIFLSTIIYIYINNKNDPKNKN
jgi:VanZ family protein